MKAIFFILVMVIIVGTVSAVQPARTPFIKMKIDGIPLKTGDYSDSNSRSEIEIRS